MRALALLGCLLLAVNPAAGGALLGQSQEDPQGAVLPARLAVATAAQVVAGAIAEAQRDGTPDQAQAQVEGLRAMAAAMAREPLPESASFRGLAQASVAYVGEIAEALAPLPGEVAAVERVRANCAAWLHNATALQRFGWAEWARPALLSLQGRADLLDALAARPPSHVDPAPLRAAAAQLREELQPRNEEACLPQLDLLAIILSPTSAWPTSNVTALIASTRAGVVLVESDLVRAEVTVTRSGNLSFQVPGDAAAGPHPIHARMGATEATATLNVTRAPSRLRLDVPPSALVRRDVRIGVQLSTPLLDLAGEGTVAVDGDLAGEVRLVGGRGEFGFTPEALGPVRLRFVYSGTPHVDAAKAEAVVDVTDPPIAPAALYPTAEPVDSAPVAPLLVLALGGVAAAAIARALRRRRAPPSVSTPEATLPHPPDLPIRFEGVVGAMVAIVQALRARGLAHPSDTVREVAARVPHAEVRALVGPFERTRYGALPDGAAPSLLARAVQRVRAWLGAGA